MRFAAIWQGLSLRRKFEMQAVVDAAGGSKQERVAHASTRRRARLKRFALVSLLLLAGWIVLAWFAARSLVVSAELPQGEMLVVLGGSSTYVERAQEAAQLFAAGRAPKIILTNDGQQGGWSQEEQRNPFFVERTAKELEQRGVPAERIEVLPQLVSSTYDEALLLRRYAEAHQIRSILVVTSAYHSRRALWTMRRVFAGSGIEIGLASPATGWQTPPPATWWLHTKGWRVVAGEYVKLVYYRLSY